MSNYHSKKSNNVRINDKKQSNKKNLKINLPHCTLKNGKKPVHLELYKGTGSFSKVSEKMGFHVISLDIIEKYKPTILMDILQWDYKTYFQKNNIEKVDIITASIPCNSFSTLGVNLRKMRDPVTMKPLNNNKIAILGDKLVAKTVEIINYCKSKNPNLRFLIENPHGFLFRHRLIKKYKRTPTRYSLYDHIFDKLTDFFHNFDNLVLRNIKTHKRSKRKRLRIYIDKTTIEQRYSIPNRLIKDIFKQYINEMSNKKILKCK